MGKDNGFLIYGRKDNECVPPLERAKNFNEFHAPLAEEERREQAARCMDCGVPMCQSAIRLAGMVTGCPLHNLIPEWNDALFNGRHEEALKRLLATSSFPEFTGRVCPALCEKACNCASDGRGGAVSIHDNELFIIERAFALGMMKPRVPKARSGKRVAVVGSGPAGLAAADALNRRGHSVTVFERDDAPGGLLMYGIPNMKLDKKIVARRAALMKAEGVVFECGANVGAGKDASEILRGFDAVALCCGAKKPRALNAAGIEAGGVMFAVDFLSSVTRSLVKSNLSDGAFFNPKGKDVVIVGGGDTGNDCAGTVIRLGAKSVAQLEMMPRPHEARAADNPWPQWPRVLKTDYGQEEAAAKFGRDPREWQTTVKEVLRDGGGMVRAVKTSRVEFKTEGGKRRLVEIEESEKEIPCALLLVAAGFTGCEEYTAEAFGAPLTTRGTVASFENSCRTSVEKVFVAGDMRRGQSLVVWAVAEGRECAREIDEYLTGCRAS